MKKKWFGKIKNKFLLMAIVFGVLPILLVGIISNYIFYRNLVASNEQRAVSNLHIAYENFRQITRETEQLSRIILSNEVIENSIRSCYSSDGQFLRFSVAALSNIHDNLRTILANTNTNLEIFLFGMDGRHLTASANHPISSITEITGYNEKDWFLQATFAKGKEQFYLKNVLNNGPFCSTVKELRSLSTQEPYAVVVINIHQAEYLKVLPDDIVNVGLSLFLYDTKLDTSFCLSGDAAVLPSNPIKELSSEHSKSRCNPAIHTSYDTRSSIYVLSVVDKAAVVQTGFTAIKLALILVLLFSLFSLIGSAMLSYTITRPLNRLGKLLQDINDEKEISCEGFDDSEEVGRIGNAFLHMLDKNHFLQRKLIELSLMEKNAEIKALQSQINPHFLYNTLSSIYWLCKTKKSEEAAEISILLSDNFKYIMDNKDDFVPVSLELKYVMQYLKLQNIRFGQKIETEWQIDPEINDLKIMKFILQPIVENALYHGLEPKCGDWHLMIKGSRENDTLLFVIYDNGVGMEDIRRIHNGYGINNVIRRIKLKYGEEYGCDYVSSPGNGTTVSIRIPVQGE